MKPLLLIHAIITALAGIVLILAPGLIPGTVGISLQPGQYLLSYLLGAAEVGIAVLSLGAASLQDAKALRLVARSTIVFHLGTAAVEGYAYTQGLDANIWMNVALRVVISTLFWYFGFYRDRRTDLI